MSFGRGGSGVPIAAPGLKPATLSGAVGLGTSTSGKQTRRRFGKQTVAHSVEKYRPPDLLPKGQAYRMTVTPTDDPSISYVSWFNNPGYPEAVAKFVRSILSNVMTEERVSWYLADEFFPIWIQAFTHETYNADRNWEVLEYRGDYLLRYLIPKRIAEKFPGLTQSDYTQLYIIYSSYSDQEERAKALGFDHYMRSASQDADSNLLVDCIESFFGALDVISEKIEPGSGPVVGYELVKILYDDMVDRLLEAYGAPKTQVSQFFGEGGVEEAVSRSVLKDGSYELTMDILIPPYGGKYLTELGFDLSLLPDYPKRNDGTKIIGSAKGRTNKTVSSEAYRKALYTLQREVGLNTPEFNRRKDERQVYNVGGNEVFAKLDQMGYERPRFVQPNKTSTAVSRIVQFVADKDGKSDILGTVRISGSKASNQELDSKAYSYLVDLFLRDD
jgi:dsRNA-specific ribonuclease